MNTEAAPRLPRISVVVPSLDQGRFIRATLDSVLGQGYPDLELWVVDGGSTDETLDVLRSYGNRLAWVSERDAGQADAVNRGITRSTGDVVGWLNSDDTYLPGALATVGRFLSAHPEVDAVYGDAYFTDRDGRRVRPYPTRDFDWQALAQECYLCQPAVFVRRGLLERGGKLDTTLAVALDYELWIRLFRDHPPTRLPAFLATSRMYPENKTLAHRRRAYREIFQIVRRNYGYVPYSWALGRASYAWHGNDQFHEPRRTTAWVFALAFLTLAWYNRHDPRYLWRWIAAREGGLRDVLGGARRDRPSPR